MQQWTHHQKEAENLPPDFINIYSIDFSDLINVYEETFTPKGSEVESLTTEDDGSSNGHPKLKLKNNSSRPVKLKEFKDHLGAMSANFNYEFMEEFSKLDYVGEEQPSTASDLAVNAWKNRFINILPYDCTRFKLRQTDKEGSDYINANYMSGVNSSLEYIVTQGPLPHTRDDFWRMVWESNCSGIVMLTVCVDRGWEHCNHYWPYTPQPQYYGDIQVTMVTEIHHSQWTTRDFTIKKDDNVRRVTQFHFTGWPDYGVPDTAESLVEFTQAFRQSVPSGQMPIIVHCSAGVGRSGTFISLDRAIQLIDDDNDAIDVFGMVYNMRLERMWMVQTLEQYIYIHKCILHYLNIKHNTDITKF